MMDFIRKSSNTFGVISTAFNTPGVINKIRKLFSEKIDSVLYLSILFLLVFIPLYPKLPLQSVTGTYVAIRLEDIFISLILGVWLLANITKIKVLLSKEITKAFLIFWMIGLLSLISAIFITSSVAPHLGFLHLLRRIEVMSLFFVAATTFRNVRQVSIAVWVMIATAAVVVIYGFGQVYLDFPVISTTNKEFSTGLILKLTPDARPNSTFAGHYDLAIYLSFILILLASVIFQFKNRIKQVIIAVLGIASLLLLGITAARISFVAAILGIIGSFWLLGKRLFIILLLIMSVISVLTIPQLRDRFIATFVVNILERGNTQQVIPQQEVKVNLPIDPSQAIPEEIGIKEKTEQDLVDTKSAVGLPVDLVPGEPTDYTQLDVSRSLTIRLAVEWPRAISAFTKNPVLGTGYSSISEATDNDILRSLGEVGLLGTFSIFLIFLIICKQFLKSFQNLSPIEKAFVVASIGIIINVLITSTFMDLLEASKVATLLWIILGISWAITKKYEDFK